jgi:CheY-like chemotaxis protein
VLSLPLIEAPNEAAISQNADQPLPTVLSDLRILCTEDNPVNQLVVRKLLEKDVASLTFANNGQEALDRLENATFDLILMDIHMPIKDGVETTFDIRNSAKPWSNIKIIALTADASFQQKRMCINVGMNDALTKPFRRKRLIDIVEKTMGLDPVRQTPQSPLHNTPLRAAS